MQVYKSIKEKERDIILANSTKAFSFSSSGKLTVPSSFDALRFAEDKAAATVRLSLDKYSQKNEG